MGASVTVEAVGGPTVQLPWTQGMTAQQAIEAAYNQINSSATFTYALQFYGSQPEPLAKARAFGFPTRASCPWRITELGENWVFSGFDTMPGCAMSSSFSFI